LKAIKQKNKRDEDMNEMIPCYISVSFSANNNIMNSNEFDAGIVRELVLSTGGDDDMGTLLGMMHSAPPSALQLKAHILKVGSQF
jgi:hypothetical protein